MKKTVKMKWARFYREEFIEIPKAEVLPIPGAEDITVLVFKCPYSSPKYPAWYALDAASGLTLGGSTPTREVVVQRTLRWFAGEDGRATPEERKEEFLRLSAMAIQRNGGCRLPITVN